jgi:adenine phosphoribosyltransferase
LTEWTTAIRDVPNYPRPGIIFKDITPLWADPALFESAVKAMSDPFRGAGIEKVIGIESRGFIFGAAVAMALAAGFVPARKPGKLPRERRRVDYALEYGHDALEIHQDALSPGERCLLVDDVLATGGTAGAAVELVRAGGGRLVGVSFFLELSFLNGRLRLPGEKIESVLVV